MNHDKSSAPAPDPELDRVARLLDDAAAQAVLDKQAAEELEHAPGLERVERILQSTWGESTPPRRRRSWFGVFSVVAVAATILAVLMLRAGHPTANERPRDQFLSANDLGLVHPLATAERWDRIEWRGPRDGTYKLQVTSEEGVLIYGPIDSIRGTGHDLPPEVTARWPAKIAIDVWMRQKDGTWITLDSRTCELRD